MLVGSDLRPCFIDIQRKHSPQFQLWYSYYIAVSTFFRYGFVPLIKIQEDWPSGLLVVIHIPSVTSNNNFTAKHFLNMLENVSQGKRKSYPTSASTSIILSHSTGSVVTRRHHQTWGQCGRDLALSSSQFLLLRKQVNWGFSVSFVQNKIVISFKITSTCFKTSHFWLLEES